MVAKSASIKTVHDQVPLQGQFAISPQQAQSLQEYGNPFSLRGNQPPEPSNNPHDKTEWLPSHAKRLRQDFSISFKGAADRALFAVPF